MVSCTICPSTAGADVNDITISKEIEFAKLWGYTQLIKVNLFAAVMKFVPVPAGSPQEQMMQQMSLTTGMMHVFGVIEIVSVILYLVPRTSTIGFVLMVGYFGGVLATLLTHGQDATMIYIVLALLTVSAYFRNPELLSRLR